MNIMTRVQYLNLNRIALDEIGLLINNECRLQVFMFSNNTAISSRDNQHSENPSK